MLAEYMQEERRGSALERSPNKREQSDFLNSDNPVKKLELHSHTALLQLALKTIKSPKTTCTSTGAQELLVYICVRNVGSDAETTE